MKIKSIHILILIVQLVLLNACFIEDQKIPAHEPGEESYYQISQSVYNVQSYFKLSEDTVVWRTKNGEWDLGFESGENDWRILLNSADYLKIARTGSTDFDALTQIPENTSWHFDRPDGNIDSTAIGMYFDSLGNQRSFTNEVYLLGRYNGISYSVYKKFRIDSVNSENYYLRAANIDNSDDQVHVVPKDTTVDFVHYSFKDGGSVSPQPLRPEWDFVFTQYATTIFTNDGIPTPYTVRGIFINPDKIAVAVDSLSGFANITREMAEEMQYTTRWDAIGYEWKEYIDDVYVVNSEITFLVIDYSGFYYKLRFVDYYNNEGEKGFPAFEFQRL